MNQQNTLSQSAQDLKSTLGNIQWMQSPLTGTTTSVSTTGYIQMNPIRLSNPLPEGVIPIDKIIFPFREKTVYKSNLTDSLYYIQLCTNNKLEKDDYAQIGFAEYNKYGILPEQLITVIVDKLSGDESKEYTEAVKHLRVAQAYLEKYSLENGNS